ncbi:hypothetical protein ACAW63_10895 [Pseudomonas sp. QE6]|uniref:hypothetical protein n=1 Tax=Pseudomonas sp. QE6 TaxID=3242491 RepID=UPI0035279220
MALTVELSDFFSANFSQFPHDDKVKIALFIKHCQANGLNGLPGKLKPSTDVPGTDPDYYTKVQYARDNYLWHYHIGIPDYEKLNPFSKVLTSRYVLHFQRFPGNKVIRIVDLDDHRPMTLPKREYMIKT